MIIAFIGDSHGNWKDLEDAIEIANNFNVDKIVQVGDFGFWPEYIDRYFITDEVTFIDGNHEHFTFLYESVNKNKKELQQPLVAKGTNLYKRTDARRPVPGLWYAPRGTIVEWGGARIAFFGGAYSIDQHRRTIGVDYFQEEEPTMREIEDFHLKVDELREAGKTVDLLITHDAPYAARKAMQEAIGRQIKDYGNSKSISDRMEYLGDFVRPRVWIHGHWHFRYEKPSYKRYRTHLIGLAKAPDIVMYDTDLKRFVYI